MPRARCGSLAIAIALSAVGVASNATAQEQEIKNRSEPAQNRTVPVQNRTVPVQNRTVPVESGTDVTEELFAPRPMTGPAPLTAPTPDRPSITQRQIPERLAPVPGAQPVLPTPLTPPAETDVRTVDSDRSGVEPRPDESVDRKQAKTDSSEQSRTSGARRNAGTAPRERKIPSRRAACTRGLCSREAAGGQRQVAASARKVPALRAQTRRC